MEGFGIEKLVLVFAIFMLLFGAKRIPELASGMGRGIRDFKKALNGADDPPQNALGAGAAAQQLPPAAQPAAAAPAAAAAYEEPKRLA
jgi:sec-independent protein translocase protein TatA